jgi:superfamily II DNA/RNA helicase
VKLITRSCIASSLDNQLQELQCVVLLIVFRFQVIVFCTTAMVTEFMYIMLRDLKLNVREIHSRKPQLYRTRISEEFRGSNRLVLVTSDVSTRGVNYPDVTLVIQVKFDS